MANFFFNSKNPISTNFWPISPIFGSKKKFSKKIRLCRAQGLVFQYQISEKPNDTIPRKHPNRQQDKKMDRPIS